VLVAGDDGQYTLRMTFRQTLSLGAMAALAACSDGGCGGAAGPWLFAVQSTPAGYRLAAIEAFVPGTSVEPIEAAGAELGSSTLFSAHEVTVDGEGGAQAVRLAFARPVGDQLQLFTVEAGRGQPPRAERRSTFSAPLGTAFVSFFDDWLDAGAGAFIVRVDPSDGTRHFMLVDYGAAPLASLPGPAPSALVLGPLRSAAGAIVGWAVSDGDDIYTLDTRWSPASLRTAGSCASCDRPVSLDVRGGMWLFSQQGPLASRYLKFLPTGGVVSDPGGVVTDVTDALILVADDGWLYWSVGADLFRAAAGGGPPERIHVLPAPMAWVERLAPGPTRLIFQESGALYSLPKAGGNVSPTLLFQGALAPGVGYRVSFVVRGGTVVIWDAVAGAVRLVREDGSGAVDVPGTDGTATEAQVTCRGAPSWSAASVACLVVTYHQDGSCTAWSYDAATMAPLARLGSITSAPRDLALSPAGSGTIGLIVGYRTGDAPDVFIADLAREGSLSPLGITGSLISYPAPYP